MLIASDPIIRFQCAWSQLKADTNAPICAHAKKVQRLQFYGIWFLLEPARDKGLKYANQLSPKVGHVPRGKLSFSAPLNTEIMRILNKSPCYFKLFSRKLKM